MFDFNKLEFESMCLSSITLTPGDTVVEFISRTDNIDERMLGYLTCVKNVLFLK